MPLVPGTKLGPYEVVGPLGAGGMGEVYRASDTKLRREVALKVLPELFADDAHRMMRFEREAQVLASLNHPHIAHIHGMEESNGIRALVMELVEGQTLAERIAKGSVPLEEAVPLAKQTAEGLEYAHDRGIIHRDLKPANIKLTSDGQVKILDFGLAKALEGEAGEVNISASPTISTAATRAGVLLGTAAYMSPEQAKGKAVDRRADIWAFGCVLFEMLAGKAAFGGETITDTLAAVVRAEPEWTRLPKETPRRIRELLQRCLTKDSKQRLQAIGEARIALENAFADDRVSATATNSSRVRFFAGAAIFFAVATIVIGIAHWSRTPEKARIVRSYIKAMPKSSFVVGAQQGGFAISPDGLRIAYVAQNADGKALLWVRSLDSLQAQALEGTNEASFPFWSPDSHSIGFFALGKLKKIKSSGGPSFTICDAPNPRGGSWNQDGVILFAPNLNVPLHRVSANGGAPVPVTTLDPAKGITSHRWPQFLPDGHHFLYVAGTLLTPNENPTNAIMLGALDSKESKLLLHAHASAQYVSGHILFLHQSTLMAQPFDVRHLDLTGEAFPIADPVQETQLILRSMFSASENGPLAYLEGTSSASRELIWLDRNGKKVGEIPGADDYMGPRISPDGKKVLYTVGLSSGYDIWSYEMALGLKTRLTFATSSGRASLGPLWSPDGQRIAYTATRNGKFGFYQKPANGSGNEEVLLEENDSVKYPNDWSSDGKFLAFHQAPQGINEIWMLSLTGERKATPFLQFNFSSANSTFSPNGKWLAYSSTESGDQKVYVVPFPGPGGKWQVSPDGGSYPRWRRDGKELFYVSADNKIVAAEVKADGANFAIGAVNPLFETRVCRTNFGGFDVAADGQRFIICHEPGQPNVAITLVENWDAELKKK